MMNIGIVDVDGHHFPNFALMRASAYHKARGDQVEWATPFNQYDKVLASKVFTFTPDFNYLTLQADIIEKGGTGYDIKKQLSCEIESSVLMDYSIYPQYNFSLQFFSRGCRSGAGEFPDLEQRHQPPLRERQQLFQR